MIDPKRASLQSCFALATSMSPAPSSALQCADLGSRSRLHDVAAGAEPATVSESARSRGTRAATKMLLTMAEQVSDDGAHAAGLRAYSCDGGMDTAVTA
jgi:hypothetical protein